jgi:HEAT repeat protein
MSSATEYADYYLERLRQGHEEDAFFSLIEADPAVLPVLMEAFAKEENRPIRAQILQCIRQQRRQETINFLAEVLNDPEPGVWKEALDGLVAIGSAEASQAVQAARTRIPAERARRGITIEWIDEALEQLRERGTE